MKRQLRKNLTNGGAANFISAILDFLFPPACLLCNSKELDWSESFICKNCFKEIPFITPPFCQRCSKPFFTANPRNHLCSECMSKKNFFNQVRAIGKYEGVLKIIIHKFKYRGNFSMLRLLNLLIKNMPEDTRPLLNSYDFIIPVPLHRTRLRERGFNQAVLFGKIIAREYGIPLKFMTLQRITSTFPQTMLPVTTRKLNVRDAFRVKDQTQVESKRILLVDDVYTTGATINECARILKKAGAAIVDGLVIARAM